MEHKEYTYTAANIFPTKILTNMELLNKIMNEKKIPPIHVQLNPTNRCNLNCPFCSCSARDKRMELSREDIKEIMSKARRIGCESVTITGGGEPLMHPNIFDIIRDIGDMGIKIGLVSNGLLLDSITTEIFSYITWIRISSGDNRGFPDRYKKHLENAMEKGQNVDWSFSHVVTAKPNYDTIRELVKFANKHACSHVRLVSDLLDLNAVKDMKQIKKILNNAGISDELVIYQGRKKYVPGVKKCLISLLKPVVGADGMLYPCCGTQYALENPGRDYEKTMNMGPAKDIDKLYENQAWFDGSVCVKCYYDNYNKALDILLADVHHKEFV